LPGPDPLHFGNADPDPHQIKKSDPDPHQRDADPQYTTLPSTAMESLTHPENNMREPLKTCCGNQRIFTF